MSTTKAIVIFLLVISFINRGLVKKSPPPPEVPLPWQFTTISELKIKNFILKQNPRISKDTAETIALNIIKYSEINNIDAKLITALICRESRFNSKTVSKSGAMGLGQLMPFTAKEMGVDDPFDPEQNIRGTVAYFRKMLNLFPKHPQAVEMALASYRIGYGVVKNYSEPPPIPEVEEFIQSIKKFYSQI